MNPGNGVDRRDRGDAATLMTLLHVSKRPKSIRRLLPGWDMLQVNVPSREQMETAIAILVGSGFAEVDPSWGMRLTEKGGQLRRSVKGAGGMRQMPGAISDLLAGHQLDRAHLSLPESVYASAREEYLDRARQRAEHASQPRHRWWWPDPFRRPAP